MEAEVARLKLNADNLALCLHTLLKRVEQLEGTAKHANVDYDPNVLHVTPEKSKNDAVEELRDAKVEINHDFYANGYNPDVQIAHDEKIFVDPETGAQKRTKVTERYYTTRTFRAIAVNDDCPSRIKNPVSLEVFEPRVVTLRGHPFNDITYHQQNGTIIITEVKSNSKFIKDIHVGDAVIEINGQPVSDVKDPTAFKGNVTLKLVYTPVHHAPPIFYRSLAESDVSNTDNFRQKWSALNLRKGEVVQVLSQDEKWLQARKVNDVSKVGLIATNHPTERVLMMTPYGRRVLILLGVSGVGRRTIKSMLLSFLPQYFATVTPFTSRLPRTNEEDGRQYYFRTKEDLTKKVRNGEMIEWGELDKQIYGTSIETVRECVKSGRVCVLDCAPQALRALYTREFMPFVVVITPPEIDEFRQINRLRPNPRTEEQLKAAFKENQELLNGEYSRMFHLILPNRNIDITFRRLVDALNQLKTEIQWVPEDWLK